MVQTMFAVMDDMHRVGIAKPNAEKKTDEYKRKAQRYYINRQDQQRYAELEKAFDTKPESEGVARPPEANTIIEKHVSYVNALRVPKDKEPLATYSFLREWSKTFL